MKISVLMSVYYKEKPAYLNECLESLYNQTRPAEEIICVKDGELTAELNDVLNKWELILPLKIIGYEKNKGLAYALNFGIKNCSGDYIARMDTDDIAVKERFEKQCEFIKNNPDCVIVGSGIIERYYDDNNQCTEVKRLYSDFITKDSKILYKTTAVGHPTVLIKKDILDKHLYDEKVGANEDVALWFAFLKDGYNIRNMQEFLYIQRFDTNALNRRNYTKAVNELKIYMHNLYQMKGFSFRLIYPLLRFVFRLMPQSIIKLVYKSSLRKSLFRK